MAWFGLAKIALQAGGKIYANQLAQEAAAKKEIEDK